MPCIQLPEFSYLIGTDCEVQGFYYTHFNADIYITWEQRFSQELYLEPLLNHQYPSDSEERLTWGSRGCESPLVHMLP